MKSRLILAVLALASLPVAAQSYPFPTSWQKVLVCNGGAAWVDVNAYERRMLQLVVADSAAVQNLLTPSHACHDYGWNPNGTTYCKDQQIVVQGNANQGVFDPAAFSGFEQKGASPTCYSGYAPSIRVFRQGNGLKVVVHQEFGAGCCWEMDDAGHCWNQSADVPEKDLADWYFDDCRVVN